VATKFFSINDIEAADMRKIAAMLPGNIPWNPFSKQASYINAILKSEDMLKQYSIDTAPRLAAFIGQGLIETNFLQATVENLNYSAERLQKIWPSRFSPELAKQYARKPKKIANLVYADRMGNGPPSSGDGWRYRGRGFFQVTGKNNYIRYGEIANVNLVDNPDALAEDFMLSVRVAAAYFHNQGLARYADRGEIGAVSRGVNLGSAKSGTPAHGESDRVKWTANALQLVQAPDKVVAKTPAPAPAPAAPVDDTLKIGSTGPKVEHVQRMLNTLGYLSGEVDGVYGPTTYRAVLAFQHEHGLTATGNLDAAGLKALEAAQVDVKISPPAEGAPEGSGPTIQPQKPLPKAPPEPPKRSDKPLATSPTIWGSILAFFAGIGEFFRTNLPFLQPIQTPWGVFNPLWALLGLLVLGIVLVIGARVRDRFNKEE
jgi:putative chitinase